jgi:hypothetical protein
MMSSHDIVSLHWPISTSLNGKLNTRSYDQ